MAALHVILLYILKILKNNVLVFVPDMQSFLCICNRNMLIFITLQLTLWRIYQSIDYKENTVLNDEITMSRLRTIHWIEQHHEQVEVTCWGPGKQICGQAPAAFKFTSQSTVQTSCIVGSFHILCTKTYIFELPHLKVHNVWWEHNLNSNNQRCYIRHTRQCNNVCPCWCYTVVVQIPKEFCK